MSGKACDTCGGVYSDIPGTLQCSTCQALQRQQRLIDLVNQDLAQRIVNLQEQLTSAVELLKRVSQTTVEQELRIVQLEADTRYMTRIGRPE